MAKMGMVQKFLHSIDSPVHNFGISLGMSALGGGITAGDIAMAGVEALSGPFFWPIQITSGVAMGSAAIGRAYNEARQDWSRTTRTTQFNKEAAATMRQRAINAIHDSRMNARSALGQEASLLHR